MKSDSNNLELGRINRRALLQLAVASAALGLGFNQVSAKGLRVVVAGAGIVGASIAYHLAKAGAAVTVVDQEGPATHASRGTFAWINATWAKQPRHYHTLNQNGLANWKGLQRVIKIPLRWNGSLEWFEQAQRQEKLKQQIREQVAWGERARFVSSHELALLEPQVNFRDARNVAFSENDGAVDPVVATKALLEAATSYGATIKYPCTLNDVIQRSGRVTGVATTGGEIKTDKVVLATGAAPGVGQRIAGFEIPQRSTPGVIAVTEPLPAVLNRVLVAPGIHLHQRDDGRIVLGEQAGAPQNEAHAKRLEGRPDRFPGKELALQHAKRMIDTAVQFLPAISGANVKQVYIGWRPLPLDGHPVLGVSPVRPDVYLAVMHSGVSLAPIVGQLAAHEIVNGVTSEHLNEYRPDRDYQLVRRY
jgi:glycine/D-amino acid oxidase-like deaminating enzyme